MKNKKLIVVGMGEESNYLKEIAQENIEFVGHVDQKHLIKLMKEAKAFIYAAIEDFGIVPIEATSCGTPVIALNQGGTAETIIDGLNGMHFQNQSVKDICDSIERFEQRKFVPKIVRDSSLKYNNFKSQFKDYIEQVCTQN